MSTRGIRARAARAGGALALVVLLAMLPWPAAAAEPAGRVIFGVGDTVAVAADGSERTLGRDDDVHVGDTLVTGPDGRVQVRFDDGALLDLKPDSRFGLDEYREPVEDRGGSVLMRLFKGAMRTITGVIGRGAEDEYRVDTPVATIGIRGTEYSLQYCDADCAGAGRAHGLYGRTDDGRIRVSNEHGSRGFDAGHYFFVPPDGPPELLLTPPPGVLDGSENGRTGRPGGDEDNLVPGGVIIDTARANPLGLDLDGDPFAPRFEEGDDRGEDAGTRILLDGAQVAGGFVGGGIAGRELYLSASEGEAYIDGAGAVVEAEFPTLGNLDASGMRLAEFDTTSAGDADVTWGRLSGTFTRGGPAFDGGFTFAYMDAADLTDPRVLQGGNLGTIVYTNPLGPAAVDQTGGLWKVDSIQITATLMGNFVINLDELQVSSVGGGDLINFNNVPGTLDLAASGFTITGASANDDQLTLEGKFIGAQADGTLVLFQIDEVTGLTIVGTHTVTQ